jgi:hypothetical protein
MIDHLHRGDAVQDGIQVSKNAGSVGGVMRSPDAIAR